MSGLDESLLHQLGAESYAQALSEHRRVVRDACARGHCVEVDAQGDVTFFVFLTAPAASCRPGVDRRACVGGAIGCARGAHGHAAARRGGRTLGADVHRAARIAAAGYGGQVLVSEATAALVDASLQPLGEHRLRDLLEPLRLFQLLAGDFPALASLGATNLPVQLTPFCRARR